MFFVINREKLYSYMISIITVIMLFCITGMLTMKNNSVETASNIQNQESIQNNIENKNGEE